MIDLEQQVKDSLSTYGASIEPDGDGLDDVLKRVRRSRRRRSAGVVASGLLLAAVTTTGLVMRIDGTHRAVVPADDGTTVTELVDAPDSPPVPGKFASLLGEGESKKLAVGPLAGRFDPAAVWTGDALIIWGGADGLRAADGAPMSGEAPFADGAAYDPVTDAWTALPPAPITARSNPAAVWTGTEMLIWGGGANGTSVSDGAAYNPETNVWRTLPPFSLTDTIRPSVVWTGTEMIVLAGINGEARGAAYNPTTDAWRPIAAPPGRSVTPYPQAVWTGDRAIVEVGIQPSDQPVLAEYDPVTDRWDTLRGPAIPVNSRPTLLWTGTEVMMLRGGTTANAAWNPTTRTWRSLAAPGPALLLNANPVWTGDAALFWTGDEATAVYLADTDSWQTLTGGALTPRLDASTVWADGVLLTWSGFSNTPDGGASGAADGLAWRPDERTALELSRRQADHAKAQQDAEAARAAQETTIELTPSTFSETGAINTERNVHPEEGSYVVAAGDYPSTIASKFKVAFQDLLAINGWTIVGNQVPEFPPVGTTIKLPPGWSDPETSTDSTTVKPADLSTTSSSRAAGG